MKPYVWSLYRVGIEKRIEGFAPKTSKNETNYREIVSISRLGDGEKDLVTYIEDQKDQGLRACIP